MKAFSTLVREQLGLKNDPQAKAERQVAPGARLPKAEREMAGVDRYTTLDQLLPIKAIVRFKIYEEECGAYLLQRPDGTFQFVFGLDIGGYHSFLLEHQMGFALPRLRAATTGSSISLISCSSAKTRRSPIC
jgi:hypothetical protein